MLRSLFKGTKHSKKPIGDLHPSSASTQSFPLDLEQMHHQSPISLDEQSVPHALNTELLSALHSSSPAPGRPAALPVEPSNAESHTISELIQAPSLDRNRPPIFASHQLDTRSESAISKASLDPKEGQGEASTLDQVDMSSQAASCDIFAESAPSEPTSSADIPSQAPSTELGLTPSSSPSIIIPDMFSNITPQEAKISSLRKDILRLEMAISKIELERKDVDDWFFEQMTASRASSQAGIADSQAICSEAEIKILYKKRNTELKRTLNGLVSRLSDTRFVEDHLINHLLPENVDIRAYIRDLLEARRRGCSTKESHLNSIIMSSGVFPSSQNSAKTDMANFAVAPFIKSDLPPSTITKSQTLPVYTYPAPILQMSAHSNTLPLNATNSARATRLKPVATPDSVPSDDLCTTASISRMSSSQPPPVYSSPLPSQSYASLRIPAPSSDASMSMHRLIKKKKTFSGVLKSGLGMFGRSFRRLHTPSSISRSLSEENFIRHINSRSYNAGVEPDQSTRSSLKIKKCTSSVNFNDIISKKSKHQKRHGTNSADLPVIVKGPASSDLRVGGVEARLRQTAASLRSVSGLCAAGGQSSLGEVSAEEGVRLLLEPASEGSQGGPATDAALTAILEALSASSHSHPMPKMASSCSSQSGVMASVASSAHQAGTSSLPVALDNVASALVLLHQHHRALLQARDNTQLQSNQSLHEDIGSVRGQLTECRTIVNSMTVEIESLRRDIQTKEEVANQKLLNALTRLEQLDASAEEWRQNLRQELVAVRKDQRRALETLEYQLTTKTRDLHDVLTTVNNKVNMIEKSVDQSSVYSGDQPRGRRLFMHTLADFCVSLFALITTLIQVLIRFLNAGATITQNRATAIFLNIALVSFITFVFMVGPLIGWWRQLD